MFESTSICLIISHQNPFYGAIILILAFFSEQISASIEDKIKDLSTVIYN